MELQFPQTKETTFNLVCEHMGKLAHITVSSGERMLTKLQHEHKRMVTIGWIVGVEISKDQHKE